MKSAWPKKLALTVMDSFNKDALHDWVEAETQAIDVVASWESLCDTYRVLEFNDQIADATKLEEFKWIIREMNKHLSRARKMLMSCKDQESMMESLQKMFVPTGGMTLINRKDVAYHKLRQMWITRMMARLATMTDQEQKEEQEDGSRDFWLD